MMITASTLNNETPNVSQMWGRALLYLRLVLTEPGGLRSMEVMLRIFADTFSYPGTHTQPSSGKGGHMSSHVFVNVSLHT